tara:strand:- start:49 stop:201 length:153 start_codon:yes stop_codon:yes gene_type:complete
LFEDLASLLALIEAREFDPTTTSLFNMKSAVGSDEPRRIIHGNEYKEQQQ